MGEMFGPALHRAKAYYFGISLHFPEAPFTATQPSALHLSAQSLTLLIGRGLLFDSAKLTLSRTTSWYEHAFVHRRSWAKLPRSFAWPSYLFPWGWWLYSQPFDSFVLINLGYFFCNLHSIWFLFNLLLNTLLKMSKYEYNRISKS